MIFYPLLLTVSGLWFLHRWQQQSRMYKMGNEIPGPAPLPIIGNALITLGKSPDQLVDVALNYAQKYGNVVRVWFGPKLLVFLADPQDIELILSSQVHIDKAS